MNIRGQIDQVVTSVIVLFAVVFLMLIFTYATAVLNLFSSGDGFVMHNNEPRDIAVYSAFLDLFLSDRVYTEGAYLGVREAIAAMTSEGNEKAAFAVEQLFRQHYACDSDSFLYLENIKASRREQKTVMVVLIQFRYMQFCHREDLILAQ